MGCSWVNKTTRAVPLRGIVPLLFPQSRKDRIGGSLRAILESQVYFLATLFRFGPGVVIRNELLNNETVE
jgi:hypothetical protein